MSTLLFAQGREPVSSTEAEVRSTVTVVDNDAAPAMADSAPDTNEFQSDPDTEGGLTSHALASHVIPRSRYVPQTGEGADNGIVNDRISSSGTAAAREAAGEWGHGTLMITEGIEPAFNPDRAFGEEYFAAGRPDIQEPAQAYMTPASAADPNTIAAAQATGNRNARQAASPYAAFLAERTGK